MNFSAGLGLLTPADLALLTEFAESWGEYRRLGAAMNAMAEQSALGGLLDKTTNGNLVQHALLGARRTALANARRAAAEMWGTPIARGLPNRPPQESPASKYLRR